MRTLVDIPEGDIRRLDELAVLRKRSRAAEIREAIGRYLLDRNDKSWIDAGAGFWKGRDEIADFVERREDRDIGWPEGHGPVFRY